MCASDLAFRKIRSFEYLGLLHGDGENQTKWGLQSCELADGENQSRVAEQFAHLKSKRVLVCFPVYSSGEVFSTSCPTIKTVFNILFSLFSLY